MTKFGKQLYYGGSETNNISRRFQDSPRKNLDEYGLVREIETG